MAEVLIAGSGIAGAALAILLGRNGRTVELFERARFPRDKACGEGLMPAGARVIERLGLRSYAGGSPFLGIRYHSGAGTAEGAFPATLGRGLGQRRTVLDTVLFDEAARSPGVVAHTGAHVEEPIVEGGRVIGLRVDREPHYGKLVVAADGVRSSIRHALGLDVPAGRKRIGIRAHYRLREGRSQPPWVEVFACPGYELYVTPLPERQLLVAALADAGNVAPPAKELFERWWQAQPVLADRLDGAEQVSTLSGIMPLGARARNGVGRGVILLGDAAGFIDPVTGGGMAQALMSAELLAQCMPRHLDSDDGWIWRFERERSRMLRGYLLVTASVLWLSYHRNVAEKVLSFLRYAPSLFSRALVVAAGRQVSQPCSRC
jgi:flavin-dependent dehydrogenase